MLMLASEAVAVVKKPAGTIKSELQQIQLSDSEKTKSYKLYLYKVAYAAV